jgi:hypothetical protein
MSEPAGITLEAALAQDGGRLSRRVLEYALVMKRLVDQAKQPGFTAARWAPLAEMVAVGGFERVGTFKEVVRWDDYVELLTGWAIRSDWHPRVRRVSEQPALVFLELAELAIYGGREERINSVSVYEFDGKDRIRHLDVYMQQEPGVVRHKESWDYSEKPDHRRSKDPGNDGGIKVIRQPAA